MVPVGWSSVSKINHSFLPSGTGITADSSVGNLIELLRRSQISDHPWLIARPQWSYTSMLDLIRHNKLSKLQELGFDVLASSTILIKPIADRLLLFQSLDNFLEGKKINTVQNSLKEFVGSHAPDFFKKGIEKLLTCW